MSVEFALDADMGRAMQEVRDRVAAVQSSFPRDVQARRRSRAGTTTTASRWSTWRCCRKTRSARELSILGEQHGRQAAAARRRRGARRHQRPGAARGAHRPRPGAPARLRRHAGRDRHRAARGQRRPAGRPAQRPRRRTRCCASKAACATRSQFEQRRRRAPQRPVADAGRPRHAGRARDASPTRWRASTASRAINFNVFKQQDANIVATGDAVKEAMDEIRKTLPPDVELRLIYASQRLGQGLARRPAAHADRRRAADGGDRLPVPALAGAAPSSPA